MRKFKYISDLHLERVKGNYFPKISNNSNANTLFIAGDLGNPFHKNYKSFLKYSSGNFDKIFLITGNHEYYHKDMKKVLDVDNKINDIVNDIPNVSFLNRTCGEVDDYMVLGTTLWADGFRHYENGGKLSNFGKFAYNRHKSDVRWLRNNIFNKNINKKLIVMTHYLPTYQLILNKFRNHKNLDRFATDLDYLIKPPVKYWICGHTHCQYETKINNVNFGINALRR